MKVLSSIKPNIYTIERNGLYCTITLCANITSSMTNIDGKNTTIYTYDKYMLIKQRYRANLEADIKANFDDWITKGSNTEKHTEAQKVRNYRDNLLNQCDLKHCNPEKWATMTEDKQKEWTSYKQALRDIPTQNDFPYTINWPTMPGVSWKG